jgi:dipeptidase
MYCGITSVPEPFAVGTGAMMKFDPDAAFWVFNQVSNFAYTRYDVMIEDIQKVQKELEEKFISYTPVVDKAAKELYEMDKSLAREFITDYSVQMGEYTVDVWKNLYAYLFTRYMDGNVKTHVEGQQNPHLEQPGYGENWYKRIIEGTGEKFEYKGAGH